jgi:hypothetical protein
VNQQALAGGEIFDDDFAGEVESDHSRSGDA